MLWRDSSKPGLLSLIQDSKCFWEGKGPKIILKYQQLVSSAWAWVPTALTPAESSSCEEWDGAGLIHLIHLEWDGAGAWSHRGARRPQELTAGDRSSPFVSSGREDDQDHVHY